MTPARRLLAPVACLPLVVALTSCAGGAAGAAGAAPATSSLSAATAQATPTAQTAPTAGTAAAPPATPSPAATPTPSATPSATPSTSTPTSTPTTTGTSATPGLLRTGDRGPAVLAAQNRLAALGYWLGTPDGVYGDATAHAVTALQKTAGLERDGVLGPRTARALTAGALPAAARRRGQVIEIDLARQILLVVDSGKVRLVLDASSGSGEYYMSEGSRHHAVTPKGTYQVFRSVNAWDPGPLGRLYRPRYFNGGIAVHGYPSVPPSPASHGCVRVTLGAMDYLWAHELLPIGRTVVVR
jgi:N-acetylmuramoyl-L-alanine amidase